MKQKMNAYVMWSLLENEPLHDLIVQDQTEMPALSDFLLLNDQMQLQ